MLRATVLKLFFKTSKESYYVRNAFKTGDVANVKLLITVWDQKTATKIYSLDFKKCHIKRHLIVIEQFDMGPVNAF